MVSAVSLSHMDQLSPLSWYQYQAVNLVCSIRDAEVGWTAGDKLGQDVIPWILRSRWPPSRSIELRSSCARGRGVVIVEEDKTKLSEPDISGRVNCSRILERFSVTTAEECQNRYQFVMMAK